MTLLTSDAERRARLLRAALGLVVLLAACHPVRGCAESQFDLAPESRLPKWFAVPAGLQRGDVTVELSYYGPLVGSARTAIVTLRTQQGKTLSAAKDYAGAAAQFEVVVAADPNNDQGWYRLASASRQADLCAGRW